MKETRIPRPVISPRPSTSDHRDHQAADSDPAPDSSKRRHRSPSSSSASSTMSLDDDAQAPPSLTSGKRRAKSARQTANSAPADGSHESTAPTPPHPSVRQTTTDSACAVDSQHDHPPAATDPSLASSTDASPAAPPPSTCTATTSSPAAASLKTGAALASRTNASTASAQPPAAPSCPEGSASPPAELGNRAHDDDDGFTLVESKKSRRRAGNGSSSAPLLPNPPAPARPSQQPPARAPAISVSRPPAVRSQYPAFRVPASQPNFATSYDAVVALEDDTPHLKMRNIVGRDASSVLVPLDEFSFQHLANIASDTEAAIKLQQIDPEVKTTKGVLMGFSLSLPLSIVQRHPQIEEATRCVSPRDKTETRQVLITFRGELPPSLELGNWGTYYLRPYTPEPLRCFRCQRFGHHQSTCRRPVTCAICSKHHETAVCLTKYKAKETIHTRCPNCSGHHHAWNPSCPARRQQVNSGIEHQVAWVQEKQQASATPAPPGTFVWGQQTRQTPPPTRSLPPPTQEDFPSLPASAPQQRTPVPRPPSTPQPPSQPQAPAQANPAPPPQTTTAATQTAPLPPPPTCPPDTIHITLPGLKAYGKELVLSLACVLASHTGATVDLPALETAVDTIADKAIAALQNPSLPAPAAAAPQTVSPPRSLPAPAATQSRTASPSRSPQRRSRPHSPNKRRQSKSRSRSRSRSLKGKRSRSRQKKVEHPRRRSPSHRRMSSSPSMKTPPIPPASPSVSSIV